MTDNWDDLPDDIRESLESAVDDATPEDLLQLQIEFLIDEAFNEMKERADSEFGTPYESGPAKVWELAYNKGIDTEGVSWWLVSLAIEEDGSPTYIVQSAGEQISMSQVKVAKLPRLADGFQAVENHQMDELKDHDMPDSSEDEPVPNSHETQPRRISESEWEYVLDEEAMRNNEQTHAIRRASVLDSGSLQAYVLEKRNPSNTDDSVGNIGTFWGHHGDAFERGIRDAARRLG